MRALDELGGLSLIVVMSDERREAANGLAAQYGCTVVGEPRHREAIAPGMRAIALPDQRRPNAFAVSIAGMRTVVCGDTVLGTPVGALSLPAESQYGDALKGALGLRRIMREYPEQFSPVSGSRSSPTRTLRSTQRSMRAPVRSCCALISTSWSFSTSASSIPISHRSSAATTPRSDLRSARVSSATASARWTPERVSVRCTATPARKRSSSYSTASPAFARYRERSVAAKATLSHYRSASPERTSCSTKATPPPRSSSWRAPKPSMPATTPIPTNC